MTIEPPSAQDSGPTGDIDTVTTIVVSVDGSPASRRALQWCARHGHALGAHSVVVVHAIHLPNYGPFVEFGPVLTLPVMGACERQRVRALVTNEWCRPLRDAEITHRVCLLEGSAAVVLRHVAAYERASLVVVGEGDLGALRGRI